MHNANISYDDPPYEPLCIRRVVKTIYVFSGFVDSLCSSKQKHYLSFGIKYKDEMCYASQVFVMIRLTFHSRGMNFWRQVTLIITDNRCYLNQQPGGLPSPSSPINKEKQQRFLNGSRMLVDWSNVSVHLFLAVTLLHWTAFTTVSTERFDSPIVLDVGQRSISNEEKSADLAAKLLLLDELVSLENDVIETKKKRSFPGFGSPLDRISTGTGDIKGKQRKVVDLAKRRFGIPIDRIGMNRLANTRG
ncbi:osteocrin [Gastrophryne carolinensis]